MAFAGIFGLISMRVFPLSLQTKAIVGPLIILHFLVMAVAVLLKKPRWRSLDMTSAALLVAALVVVLPFSFMSTAFGVGDFSSLLITFAENRAGQMFAVGLEGFVPEFLTEALKGIVILIAGFAMVRYVSMGRGTVIVASLALLLLNPLTYFAFRLFVPHPDQLAIQQDVKNLAPNILSKPEAQKNLVIVYLESLERTYADLPISEAAFAPFAKWEDQGLAFKNIQQSKSVFFTAGGLVATQCGVPMLPRGVFNSQKRIRDDLDVIPEETDFLLGATCLGDILTRDGYNASYINGSALTIYSKGAFFKSHNYQRVMGFESYEGHKTETRRNVWGMDDDLLFERVEAELAALASEGKPFLLSTLTLGTHGPTGYPDGTCRDSTFTSNKILNAMECSAGHVRSLVEKIDSLGLSESTIVVLASDHLAYRNSLDDQLMEVKDTRRNYFTVLGADAATNLREGTALDIYPTLLELLGYELEGNRAGLGRSLIGESPTLPESIGADRLEEAIRYNTDLQKAIWNIP
ncbi:sulfatase-like hydrolase/transferase [Cognatishimia maritima]|uniref:sulfatase-like hydrolase/transferase n=1 Tax=Cognatishimia maritima TaxID=870908 RepID=UPI0013F4C449|nr:sulfatase-like hydrolase/transferase [Cognatishimia maritima]